MSDYSVGDFKEIETVITPEMVAAFAALTGDYNPIHLSQEFAARTRFKQTIAHGMLLGGLISRILGTEYPGIGTIYAGQNLRFLRPVHVGNRVRVRVEMQEIKGHRATLRTTAWVGDQAVADGEAYVVLPDPELIAIYREWGERAWTVPSPIEADEGGVAPH